MLGAVVGLPERCLGVRLADVDIVDLTAEPVDDEVLAVGVLVGEPARGGRDDLLLGSGSKVEADDGLGAGTDTVGDIVPGDDEVVAALILAAQDDMGMRMTGVEVIDRHPVEPGAQVLFHVGHQPPHQGLQVFVPVAVLGRDDEAELMTVALRAFEEALARDAVVLCTVEPALLALARRTVAFEVTHVRARRRQAFAELHDARLHDDAAAARTPRPQHARDPAAAPDARTCERRA